MQAEELLLSKNAYRQFFRTAGSTARRMPRYADFYVYFLPELLDKTRWGGGIILLVELRELHTSGADTKCAK